MKFRRTRVPRQGRRRALCTVVAAALIAVGTASCATTEAVTQDDDPGMLHVHALHADPSSDGGLLAAAHTGMFRIDGQDAERISNEWHDLMAFAVAPDGSLLASGHPAQGADHLRIEDHPPHLGLARSTDQGRTWQSVSLLGEADFHALVVAGEVLLGAEATTGQLLASLDGGTSWEPRSQIDLLALVAHPEEPELLVGWRGDELVRSEDAGRSWTPTASIAGPVAANAAGFVAAGSNGQVMISVDGVDWKSVGQLPSTPEALLALDTRIYAWTTGHGLQHSDDEGRTWQAASSNGPG